MRKIDKRIIAIVIAISILFLGLYFINNYNQYILYTFKGNDGEFYVSGNATFTNQVHVLNINSIKYRHRYYPEHDPRADMIVKQVKITIFAIIDGVERFISSNLENPSNTFSLVNYLNSYSTVLSERYNYQELFNDSIIKDFQNVMYVKIEIIDSEDREIHTTLKLEGTKYANNKLFYKKVNPIS